MGKSTLAGWLTAHGWEFLTDEVALLEHGPDGAVSVHPFWRPIGVRRPGPLDPYLDVPPDAPEVIVPGLTAGKAGHGRAPGAIVFPHYEPGSQPVLEPQSRARAVQELAAHLPTLGAEGEEVFEAIVRIVAAVPSYSLLVDDLDAAEAALERLVQSD